MSFWLRSSFSVKAVKMGEQKSCGTGANICVTEMLQSSTFNKTYGNGYLETFAMEKYLMR